MTAQDAYHSVLRDVVAPALREMGFKGSGKLYRLDDEKCWVRLGFQSSVSNSAARVKFTVNLLVADKDAWTGSRDEKHYLPEVPSPNISYGQPFWWERIGALMPSGRDHWWTITDPLVASNVALEVVAAVRKFALPALIAQRDATSGS
ncbi:DUF4304 domain-containing protein [Micromonospora purpureochromogenes]|uniref:DUF4304 domain-containing protein n=1 Tax=Micromonospora purpureochromogenes TaxID=47872 RepID=UPI0033F202E5